jgi:hypothetical protein
MSLGQMFVSQISVMSAGQMT